ncbi:MAG TPA: B12-binding domain-containing protein [Gemmatimonadaceae bacterium]|nr:B12-binding domain-containing protein [Gemmatimonadaceae bacterium]
MARSKPTDLPRHPIGVVRERTGLSVEVLRAWERRYAVVRPSRSKEGRRLYSDADVERLGLLHRASRAGRPVGALVTLSTGELRQMVLEDAERARRTPAPSGSHREHALEAVRQLAPERLEALLQRALFSLGAFTFLEEVVAPLLEEIGDAWHEGLITVAHEHAASAAVLQVLGGLARALEVSGNAPRVVLATPRGERHAFGAMMAAVAAAHDGWHVTWLGSDLPAAQVAAGAETCEARIVGLGSVARDAAGLKREVTSLRALLPSHVPVLIGGPGAARLRDMRGVTKVRDLSHWRALLTTARAT